MLMLIVNDWWVVGIISFSLEFLVILNYRVIIKYTLLFSVRIMLVLSNCIILKYMILISINPLRARSSSLLLVNIAVIHLISILFVVNIVKIWIFVLYNIRYGGIMFLSNLITYFIYLTLNMRLNACFNPLLTC